MTISFQSFAKGDTDPSLIHIETRYFQTLALLDSFGMTLFFWEGGRKKRRFVLDMLIFCTTKSNRRFFLPVSRPESVIPNVATVNQLIKKEYGERNEEPSPALTGRAHRR